MARGRQLSTVPAVKKRKGTPGKPLLQDKPCETFIENIDSGGMRDEFVGALEASGDPRWGQMFNMLTRDYFKTHKFSTICRKLQLTPTDLVEFWRNHQIQSGIIQTMNRIPKIMADVAEDAESRMDYCKKCDGLGEILSKFEKDASGKKRPVLRVCPKCNGLKKVRAIGDKDARTLVYEAAGLTSKRGPVVAVQINNASPLEATVEEIGDILNEQGPR